MLELAQQTVRGVDENQNGQIEPIPAEGGVLAAYQYAQFMADMWLAPSATGEAPAFKPAQQVFSFLDPRRTRRARRA
jgi:hypothetical protein